MEILIGREPDSGFLGLLVDGKHLRDSAYELPCTVSRLKINEKTAHCRIFVKESTGKMSITNMNSNNATYVDGEEVECSVQITEHSIIALGSDQWKLNLKKILKTIGFERPYSIKHLKKKWDKYDRTLLQFQVEQQKSANRQKLQGILSQISMLCVIIPSVIPSVPIPSILRVLLIVTALGVGFYFYMKGNKTDDSFIMKKRILDEEFRDDYVCPKCGSFLGYIPYEDLEYKKKCNNCNCKFSS